PGYARESGECDHDNDQIHPQSTEIMCNGIDDNCNGLEDDAPSADLITTTANITNVLCNGQKDGQISLDIVGGLPPYSVEWTNGMLGTSISGLSTGLYGAKITDFGGCVHITDYFEIKATSSLQSTVISITKASCLGMDDGAITIAHNTDHPPFSYAWSNGDTTMNLNNASQGIYSVTITDNLGCTSILSGLNLESQLSLKGILKSKKNPLCHLQSNGSIEFEGSFGHPPYMYSWNTGANGPLLNNVKEGIYHISITDQSGCIFTESVELVAPDSLYAELVDIVPIQCFGDKNGQITTKPVGGTPPYYYLWNFGARVDDISELSAGNYELNLTDVNGCIAVPLKVKLTNPELISNIIDTIIPSSCSMSFDGLITIKTSGGFPPYHYVWNHTLIDTSTLSNLKSGIYGFTGYDANQCKFSLQNIFLPSQNIEIPIQIYNKDINQCHDDSLNQIWINVDSRHPPFDYNWSVGKQYFKSINLDSLINLSGGLYNVTVTDHIGCVGISDSVHFKEIDPITYNIDNIINNVCPQDSAGSISLSASGSFPIQQIIWNDDPSLTGNTLSNLPNGIYQAFIQDSGGCNVTTHEITISSNAEIDIKSAIVHDVDKQGSGSICIEIISDATPYHILWDNGQKSLCVQNLKAGYYRCTITDGLGCEFQYSFIVESLSG
ncbi:MAG: hypothetical protein KDC04_06810, partial [Saprospiraceae bacterium]|nr:hypothetical protein [Saprospiraceae bacterium]